MQGISCRNPLPRNDQEGIHFRCGPVGGLKVYLTFEDFHFLSFVWPLPRTFSRALLCSLPLLQAEGKLQMSFPVHLGHFQLCGLFVWGKTEEIMYDFSAKWLYKLLSEAEEYNLLSWIIHKISTLLLNRERCLSGQAPGVSIEQAFCWYFSSVNSLSWHRFPELTSGSVTIHHD